MLKRFLTVGVILTALAHTAFAGTFYVAPTIEMNNVVAGQSSYFGVAPRVSLGYSALLTPTFLLAGEAYGSYGSISIFDHHPPDTDSMHITGSIGAGILPALKFSKDTVGFLRFGLLETKFTTGSKTRLGAQFGLGLETEITDDWDVRFEYDYAKYRSLSVVQGTPRQDSYSLGFVRRFY